MKLMKHTAAVAAILGLFLVVPALFAVNFGALFSGGTDAVSSASVILTDKPSGQYLILLNDRLDSIELWEEFFNDQEIPVIMEDISCMVITGDAKAKELADTYRSRLPENQMKISTVEGMITVSKAEYERFDVIIMSREFADGYTVSTLDNNIDIRKLIKNEEG